MKIREIGYHTALEYGQTVDCDGTEGDLLMLTHAPLTLTLGQQTLQAEAGDAVVIRSGTAFSFTPLQDDMLYDFVGFTPGNDQSFYQSLKMPENTLLRFGDTAFLSMLIGQLCAEYYAAGTKRSEMMECLLKALLIRCAETGNPVNVQKTAAASDPHYAELARLREKIYANPQEKWTVDMLCTEVNMSRSYFQLIYRETFGLTCIADVIDCKMKRARELLSATSYTISHIAQLCGYDNEEHFMRQFKKNHGMTPTAYRRNQTAQ